MVLPGIVRPSTGTTPESMSATVTPTPVSPSVQKALYVRRLIGDVVYGAIEGA